jgi:hypothetical protein
METETITIPVDPESARSFYEAPPEKRRKLELLLRLRLRELTQEPARSLEQIMDDISKNAQAKGLTPDMLESMLREEGFACPLSDTECISTS